MCKSFCILGCIVEEKRYEHGSLFITDNCLNMCSCQHRNGREILACLPLCPPLSKPKCRADEETVTITRMFSWRPPCYCRTKICWNKKLKQQRIPRKIRTWTLATKMASSKLVVNLLLPVNQLTDRIEISQLQI